MKVQIITLPKLEDKRGNLSTAESSNQIPFPIRRAYWIYDVPGGQKRGSHAFKTQQEVIFALSGSFDVVLDDGTDKKTYLLNRSNVGIYVPNKMWRTLENFSTNSICLVLASTPYSKEEYIRNYKTFKKFLQYPEKTKISAAKILPNDKQLKIAHTVFDCNLIEFPAIKNRAGNITPVHTGENIPFRMERVFFIYDIPSGETRGGHAHKTCHQILIATSGSFDVELDDGTNKRTVTLNRPMVGLYLPPRIWAVEKNYSSGATCLVIASESYTEAEYMRNYSDFKKYISDGK